MNSTTLRQDGNGSNPGRFIVKKAMSPGNENFSMNHHNLNIQSPLAPKAYLP